MGVCRFVPRSDETLTEREAYLRARAAPLVTEGDK